MTISVELCTHPELDDRISILRAGEEVDAVFVRTERFNVLVDTLGTPELCRMALELLDEDMRARPLIVVNSHMDWDHFWGNAAIVGKAPIIAHTAARARLSDTSCRQVLDEKMREEPRFRNVELIAPDITFSDSMALHGGDLTLELIHTPGHTPDHVAIWFPEIRVCLAADAVETPIPEVWNKSSNDLRLICSSLERIRDLHPKFVIPAHGRTISPSTVDDNLSYFRALAARVENLSATELANPELGKLVSLRLQDFVAIPADMSPEAVAFYETFHETNLGATIQARLEGLNVA